MGREGLRGFFFTYHFFIDLCLNRNSALLFVCIFIGASAFLIIIYISSFIIITIVVVVVVDCE